MAKRQRRGKTTMNYWVDLAIGGSFVFSAISGLVNDPHPGKCHHYVDTTGDGFCDYSVLG